MVRYFRHYDCGAPIDVFVGEPPPADSLPVGVPNLIPRTAGVTGESNRRIGGIAAANVRRVPAERGQGIGRPEALPRREGAL